MHIKQFKNIESDILKTLNHIENLILSDSSDPILVRNEVKHIENLHYQFLFVMEKTENVFSNKNILSEFHSWSEKVDQEIVFVKSSCILWLKKVEGYKETKSLNMIHAVRNRISLVRHLHVLHALHMPQSVLTRKHNLLP